MCHKIVLLLVLAMISFFGCTKREVPATPREVMAKYVETAFGVKDIKDIETLKQYTTGAARKELEDLIADNTLGPKGYQLFKKRFEDQKIESASSLRIRDERDLKDGRYSITYELTYRARTPEGKVEVAEPVLDRKNYGDVVEQAAQNAGQERKKEAALDRVTTKKHAIFVLTEGKWLISEVQGLKTYIEHTTEEKIDGDLRKEPSK